MRNYQAKADHEKFNFQIPKQTPAGQYLLRFDLVWASYDDWPAQFYPGCAQIEVESDVTGTLPEGIKIPEDLTHYGPGTCTIMTFY
jgi:hypothetical protein